MRSIIPNTLLVMLFIVGLAVPGATAQRWQWPEKAENLKVLPEDTGPEQLGDVMRSFTRALGVRCQHCHDDSNGSRLNEMNFAADAKEAKEIARVMMQMVRRINGDDLAEVDRPSEDMMRVTCVTCHRGNTRPIMLEDELAEVIAAEGVRAAIDHYHALRARHKDGFTYDFRMPVLNNLGYQLLQAGKVDDAIAIFKLNAEMFPDNGGVFDSLAEAYMTKGETERAIALYQHSLSLDPDNDNAVAMLKKLRGGE